ncbi:hypothetical protein TNCV_2483971 [Trichonephila clavipes]|uniref:Uncharacterized protein n=1 Tax=Trichonephila clavipes TaxID=2585209 RepID=A0A8X7BC91_TRICX|nr:hypothetical protein TNCV_2483971 [Trichonephila clavipes]
MHESLGLFGGKVVQPTRLTLSPQCTGLRFNCCRGGDELRDTDAVLGDVQVPSGIAQWRSDSVSGFHTISPEFKSRTGQGSLPSLQWVDN